MTARRLHLAGLKRSSWLGLIVGVIWSAVLLVPYYYYCEQWGMVWFYLTLPLSDWAKPLWETYGPEEYVGGVTLVWVFIVGGAAKGLGHLFGLLWTKLSKKPRVIVIQNGPAKGGAGGYTPAPGT